MQIGTDAKANNSVFPEISKTEWTFYLTSLKLKADPKVGSTSPLSMKYSSQRPRCWSRLGSSQRRTHKENVMYAHKRKALYWKERKSYPCKPCGCSRQVLFILNYACQGLRERKRQWEKKTPKLPLLTFSVICGWGKSVIM